MRSRYAAYAVGDLDHVFRTWHPRTRPDDLSPDPDLTWTGLEILDASATRWSSWRPTCATACPARVTSAAASSGAAAAGSTSTATS